MFLTRTELPWIQNGTYGQIIEPNAATLTQIHDEDLLNATLNEQIKSMFFLTKHHNPDHIRFLIESKTVIRTPESMATINEECTDDKKLLNTMLGGAYFVYNEREIGFRFAVVPKYMSRLLEILDTRIPDRKPISMVLQENVSHKVRVYQETPHKYLILTDKLTLDMLRKMVALTPKLFTHNTYPEDVLAIFRLFGTDEFEDWKAVYDNWIKTQNLMEKIQLEQLNVLVNIQNETKKKNTQNQITQTTREIDSYIEAIRTSYINLNNYKTTLLGLEQMKEDSAHDLYNYLTKNKALAQFRVNKQLGLLIIHIQTPWIYYDQNVFDRISNNPNSIISSDKQLAELLKMTFTPNPRFELWTETICYIKPIDNTFRTYDWDSGAGYTKLPQMHTVRYHCWGNNEGLIQKAISAGDYIGAIEQMVAASKNINWLDGPVINKLVEFLRNHCRRTPTFKDLKTNSFVSCEEAIRIIKMEKEATINEANKDNGATATTDGEQIPGTPQQGPVQQREN